MALRMTAAVLNLCIPRERDAYMQAVFNTVSQGMMIFDRDGSVRTINRAALKIHGLNTIDELYGQLDAYGRLFEWVYADGRVMPREQCPVARALKGEAVRRCLLHGRNRRSGHLWRAIYTGTPVFDEDGNVQGAVIMVQDITDPNRPEAVLARLTSMVNSAAVPIVGLTRDGIIESWNAAAESLFGYSAREIIGQHVEMLGSCEDRHNKVDTIRCVREGGVVKNLQTVRIAKDGRKIPVLLTVAPINDEVGAMVGMSASVVDITRYKDVQPELKEADCRKAEFLAMPLTVLGADSSSVGMGG